MFSIAYAVGKGSSDVKPLAGPCKSPIALSINATHQLRTALHGDWLERMRSLTDGAVGGLC